jgi:hypothetical protein
MCLSLSPSGSVADENSKSISAGAAASGTDQSGAISVIDDPWEEGTVLQHNCLQQDLSVLLIGFK